MTRTAEEPITPELVRRAKGLTHHFIKVWGLSNQIHDDLYSAAFLALVEARDKYNGSGSFSRYALKYVKARVIDEIREQLGRNSTVTSRGHSDQTKAIKRAGELHEWDYPSNIDERFDRYVDRDFLLSLANEPRTRRIIVLTLLGFTQEEIGAELNVTSSRISQILHTMSSRENKSYNDTKSNIVGGLTKREIEIIRLFASGLNTAAIANRLHLAPYTIRSHTKNIRRKLSAKTITQSVAIVALAAPELITEGRRNDEIRRSDL